MLDSAFCMSAGGLGAKMRADRLAGKSDEEILRRHAGELTALLTAPSFLTILLTILPKALPLVVGIIGDIRSGKKFLEALLSRTSEIIEVVLAVVAVLTPSQDNGFVVAPVVPK